MDAERGTFLHAELRAEKMTRSKMTKSRDDKRGKELGSQQKSRKMSEEEGQQSSNESLSLLFLETC